MSLGRSALVNGKTPAKQPRYAFVAEVLAGELRGGQYAIGSLLPTEAQLCERFSVSRATVREALRRLADLGYISKVHGVGTRVDSTEPRSNYNVAVSSVAEFMQYGTETTFIITERNDVDLTPEMAGVLGIAEGLAGVKLSGYRVNRHGDTRPISFSEIHIPRAYASVLDGSDRPSQPFYRAIATRFQHEVLGVDQEIRAISVGKRAAVVLNVPEGSPGLYILRRFFGRNHTLLEVTENIHPAERFSYRMYLNRDVSQPDGEKQ